MLLRWQDPTKAEYIQLVEVAIPYRKVTWIHAIVATEASDDGASQRKADQAVYVRTSAD